MYIKQFIITASIKPFKQSTFFNIQMKILILLNVLFIFMFKLIIISVILNHPGILSKKIIKEVLTIKVFSGNIIMLLGKPNYKLGKTKNITERSAMSKSLEDYLKGIYLLKKRKHYSNKNLAEYLNISPASVSETIKKLSNEDYLISEGRNIKLTKKGSDIAVNIIRKHRVWEVFLVEKLGYDKDEIHEEAEVLEHVTSDKLLQKLEKFLFYPRECPHGSPIFYDSDGFNEANIMKLSDTEERDEIIILSVEDNIELYDYLREMDVTIKENYNIIRKDPFNGPIYLENSEKKVKIIAYDAAKMIEIYKKNTEENNEYEQ